MSTELISQLIKLLYGCIFSVITIGGYFFVKKIYNQKQKNDAEELSLLGKRIDFEVHSKPIDSLVDESNKEHGASVGSKSGDDPKKG